MTPRIPMELGSDLPVEEIEEIEEIDEEGNPVSTEGEDNPVFREQDADTNSSASSS